MGLIDIDDIARGRLKIVDPDELLITPDLRKIIWAKRINAMVKAAKETLSHTWTAPIILAVLLGFVVYDRQSNNAQQAAANSTIQKQLHDQENMLIRIDQTRIEDQKQKDKEEQRRFQIEREDAMWRENMNVKLALATGKKGTN